MKQMMMTMKTMIRTCFAKFLRETMSLIHRTGTIFPIQVPVIPLKWIKNNSKMITVILYKLHTLQILTEWMTQIQSIFMKIIEPAQVNLLRKGLGLIWSAFNGIASLKHYMLFCLFTAKSLVSRLMEVDQDQRLTAQEAINHEWYWHFIGFSACFADVCVFRCR